MSSLKSLQSKNAGKTPVDKVLPGRKMVTTHGGGKAFAISDLSRFRRFLILGSDGATFYQSQEARLGEHVESVENALDNDGLAAVQMIVKIATEGLAHRNTGCLYALAVAASHTDDSVRAAATSAIKDVCRTGTDLFVFLNFIEGRRGWGKSLKKGVGSVFLETPVNKLALHSIKYRQREGWTYRDVLRLAHVSTSDADRNAVLNFMVNGKAEGHPLLDAYARATSATTVKEVISAIEAGLPWEAVPNEWLKDIRVWEALIPHMGAIALTRNLSLFARNDFLKPLSDFERMVVGQLKDAEYIKRSKAHPMHFLNAREIHSQGGSGGLSRGATYKPNAKVVSALGTAFEAAFKNVVPSNKRHYLGIDISGSMWAGWGPTGALTPGLGAAAMALITNKTEPYCYTVGFTTSERGGYRYSCAHSVCEPFDDFNSLNEAVKISKEMSQRMGGTNISAPMQDALAKRLDVDTFVVYTDNETTHHGLHPVKALEEYRQKMSRDAKLVVVAMTPTNFSVADPTKSFNLDVVGFDSSTPSIISNFSAGNI